MEGIDPEQMFTAFRDAYVAAQKAKEIAERDAQAEMRQAHAEMEEMRAWDEYALEAFKQGVKFASSPTMADRAMACATFANELLKQRRATFLVGDDK